MPIIKTPFRSYRLDSEKEKDTRELISVSISKKDIWLSAGAILIRQPKRSTALKQLAEIGANYVLHDAKLTKTLSIIGGNLHKNKRLGLVDEKDFYAEIDTNVKQNNAEV